MVSRAPVAQIQELVAGAFLHREHENPKLAAVSIKNREESNRVVNRLVSVVTKSYNREICICGETYYIRVF